MDQGQVVLWRPQEPIKIPKSATSVSDIAAFACQLRPIDQDKIVKAFSVGLYDLAIEFIWKRTMSILKRQLGMMGVAFIGELLARPDINEDSPVESVVTDFDAIQLALQLGILDKHGAIKLRHGAELLSFHSTPDVPDDVELGHIEALDVLRSCVVFVLAKNPTDTAFDFARFRSRLTKSVFNEDDNDFVQFLASPYFFKRTTLRVLLSEAKTEKGAQAENAMGNLSNIATRTWEDLEDPDRWQIGQAYAEATSDNQKALALSLRRILTGVRGFDYVPETLRSSTYTRVANEVLKVHEERNNFYNEPAKMKALLQLGSTIPGPAFQICMRATLSVKFGNMYGRSIAAQTYADKLLSSLSKDRWAIYLSRFLPSDDMLLMKLTDDKPILQFCKLVNEFQLSEIDIHRKEIAAIVRAAHNGVIDTVRSVAWSLLAGLGN